MVDSWVGEGGGPRRCQFEGIDRDRRNQLDDARARAKAGQRINDQRKAMGEVIAGTAIEPHSRALLTGNDAKAIVLDLVQPLAAGRNNRPWRRPEVQGPNKSGPNKGKRALRTSRSTSQPSGASATR